MHANIQTSTHLENASGGPPFRLHVASRLSHHPVRLRATHARVTHVFFKLLIYKLPCPQTHHTYGLILDTANCKKHMNMAIQMLIANMAVQMLIPNMAAQMQVTYGNIRDSAL